MLSTPRALVLPEAGPAIGHLVLTFALCATFVVCGAERFVLIPLLVSFLLWPRKLHLC